MKLHSDSDSAIKLAKNPVCHERAKHVEVHCHYIREKIATTDVVLSYVNTTHQVADFLTEAVNRRKLDSVLSKLNVINIYCLA